MNRLEVAIRGRVPLIFFNTIEINRAINYIKDEFTKLKSKLKSLEDSNIYCVNINGIVDILNGNTISPETELLGVINSIVNQVDKKSGLYLIPNFSAELYDDYVKGQLAQILLRSNQMLSEDLIYLIFIGDTTTIPSEVQILGAHIDFERPNRKEIEQFLKAKIPTWIDRKVKASAYKKMSGILTGLTLSEIELTVKSMFIKTKGNKIDYKELFNQKAELVKKTGLLEVIDTTESINEVGGLSELKNWAFTVKYIYENIDKAKAFGVDIPKGTLITGVSGCGKSLFAKAISNYMSLPLFRLDVGRLMGSLVGETEKNTRELFKIIDSISPCVIIIDEIEKMFSGLQSSGRNDGGVVERLFGNMLYYMEERNNPAFFIATANDISKLPPEFLRKGRWDEIWFVDIPNKNERVEILKIHIEKTGRKFENVFKSKKSVENFIQASADFTGAEIEQVVKEAVKNAFISNREIEAKDIIEECKKVKPLIKLTSSQYGMLKNWALKNCRLATTQEKNRSSKLLK